MPNPGWHAVTRRSRGSACVCPGTCRPDASRRDGMPPPTCPRKAWASAPAIFNRPSGTARSGPLIYRVAYEPAAPPPTPQQFEIHGRLIRAKSLLAPGRPAELANVIVEDNAVLRELRTARAQAISRFW